MVSRNQYKRKAQSFLIALIQAFGADDGIRTRDLFLTKEVLYLLSYISKNFSFAT